jgi:hypothetical protein
VRHSELDALLRAEFGDAYAATLTHDHILTALGRTPQEALAHGIPAQQVWRCICEDFSVPPERRFGREHRPRR